MIRQIIKHFQCARTQENSPDENGPQPKKRLNVFKRLRSRDKRCIVKRDRMEEEWSNSPKSRVRRNAFDIPVYVVNTNQFVHLMWDKEPLKQLKGKLVMKEFNIVKFTANATIKSTDRDGNYDYLQLHFRFYRYLAFYFLRDFFPCILIVILSWMTFWIDYQSTPARVAMGITTVLTIVTMTNNIRNNSPPAGLFRSIDYYLLMCNLFVFAALAEYALVGHYAIQSNGKRSKGKPKNDIKLYDFTGLGNMIEKEEPREKKKEDFPEEKKERDGRKNHRIDKLSRILFPTMFVIFNGIYFAFHRLHEDTVD
eukprot:gene4694-20986_t